MKSNTLADIFGRRQHQWLLMSVFSVDLVCKEEMNLMQKVSLTSSQGGFELIGTDSLSQYLDLQTYGLTKNQTT